MYLHVQVWYAWAVAWDTGASEDRDHAQRVLSLAAAAIPDCPLLSCALADALEARRQHPEALQVYEVCSSQQHNCARGNCSL